MKLFSIVLAIASVSAEDLANADRRSSRMDATFQELDRRAQIEFRRAEFARASEDFKLAAASAPENLRPAYSLFGTAAAAIKSGDWDGARQALRQAMNVQLESPLALAMLIKVDLLAGAPESLGGSLSEIAKRFGSQGKLHADLAQDLLHENQNDLALAEALRAEAAGVTDARTRINLAVLESQAGAFADAARLASEVEQQPGLSESIRAKAAVIAGLNYESSAQLPDAIRYLKRAVRLDPSQEIPYVALARIYSGQHDDSAAIEIVQQVPDRLTTAKVLLALGAALLAAEQYPAASRTLSELIRKFPDELGAYPKLAEAYRNMGETRKATGALRALATRSPQYPKLHILIAESLLDEEDVNSAEVLRELERAELTSPQEYEVYYFRGRAFANMRDYRRAADAFRRASELHPEEPGAHYQLGLAYRRLGESALANEQFDVVSFLKADSNALEVRK